MLHMLIGFIKTECRVVVIFCTEEAKPMWRKSK